MIAKTPETQRAEGNEAVIAGEKRALELAVHGAPLADVLDALVRTIEAQSTREVLGSILVLDGQVLRHGAAPSLAPAYCAAIDGIQIGPAVGSCGTAAFHGRTVVVEDIARDPLWASFKDLALRHGLRACWSTPIRSSRDEVLGTFALYHRVVTTPTERDLEIVELLGHTAALVIERDRNHAKLRGALDEQRAFIDNLPTLAWTARPDGYIDYYNRRWYEYTGTTFEEMQGWGWQKVHDPARLPEVTARWKHSLATGEPFEMEFTLRGRDDVPRWFLTRVVPMRDPHGAIVRWFGTNTDIDEIKVSRALTDAMTAHTLDAQQLLVELRDAKDRAERRARELEQLLENR